MFFLYLEFFYGDAAIRCRYQALYNVIIIPINGFHTQPFSQDPLHISSLWQCAAKVISAFLIFAVLVLRDNDCRPYTPF